MATTEKVISQELRETAKGSTFTRRFSSTYDDYNLGSSISRGIPYPQSHPFPYRVGDALNYDSVKFPFTTFKTVTLRISEIRVVPVDNVNLNIEVFYSTTLPTVVQEQQPDTNASWKESFNINSIATNDEIWNAKPLGTSIDRFMTRSARDGDEENWADLWTSAGNSATDQPPSIVYAPTWTFTLTAYSRTLYINRILTFLLSVNSDDWLTSYFKNLATNNGITSNNPISVPQSEPGLALTDWAQSDLTLYPLSGATDTLTDVGRWLFTGCNLSRVRFDSWQYDFEFVFNTRWQWNKPHGITVDKYPTGTFGPLLSGMTFDPLRFNQGGGVRS